MKIDFPNTKITVLANSSVAVSHTGNTNETVLATVTIPGGTMGPNGILRISCDWTVTNNANNKTPRIRLGGIGGTSFVGLAFTTVANVFYRTMIKNRNATNSQFCASDRSRGTDTVSTYEVVTGAVDTSVSQTLVFTAQLANGADTITLEDYLVELINP